MLTLWTNFERFVPLACIAIVGYSVVFPSKDLRTVRDLRSEFDAIRSDYSTLRDEHLATLQFIRDFDWRTVGVDSSPPADAPQGAPPGEKILTANECAYTRCHGVDGVRRGSDTWLVGERSPWGVISEAFRGGFVADGLVYSFFTLTQGSGNDK